jgi:SM-20-related protein
MSICSSASSKETGASGASISWCVQLDASMSASALIEQIASQGWGIGDGFISPGLARRLRDEAETLRAQGAFGAAAVGSGAGVRREILVRSDETWWLEAADATLAQREYLDAAEALRLAINRELQLGLFELEAHFAFYAPGAFYRRHRDRSPAGRERVISCVLYLNEAWRAEDGGALRLYLGTNATGWRDVLPEAGRLVCFQSDRFDHEVLPATRSRWSVTSWFSRRS